MRNKEKDLSPQYRKDTRISHVFHIQKTHVITCVQHVQKTWVNSHVKKQRITCKNMQHVVTCEEHVIKCDVIPWDYTCYPMGFTWGFTPKCSKNTHFLCRSVCLLIYIDILVYINIFQYNCLIMSYYPTSGETSMCWVSTQSNSNIVLLLTINSNLKFVSDIINSTINKAVKKKHKLNMRDISPVFVVIKTHSSVRPPCSAHERHKQLAANRIRVMWVRQ